MSLATLANHRDIAQQTVIENGLLKNLIEGLRAALAWQVQGEDFSRKLSTVLFIARSFQRHLERLMTLEEVDGYMDIVLEAKPSLARAVDSLRRDHDRFRRTARRLVHQIERVPASDFTGFVDACADWGDFLRTLDRHNKREARLFQEAFEREEGGEG
jgi:hypothetical protein